MELAQQYLQDGRLTRVQKEVGTTTMGSGELADVMPGGLLAWKECVVIFIRPNKLLFILWLKLPSFF